MMGYEFTLLPGEPVMVTKFLAGFTVQEHALTLIGQMKDVLDAANEPIYMLDDLLEMRLTFSDLVHGLAIATRGETGVLKHPRLCKVVMVTNSEMLRFGGTALKQSQYGAMSVAIYTTFEE